MDSIKVMAFQSLTENPSLEAEISNYEHMRYKKCTHISYSILISN